MNQLRVVTRGTQLGGSVLHIKSGDSEMVHTFVLTAHEDRQLYASIGEVQNEHSNSANFTMRDIGSWVSLTFFRDGDNISVTGEVLELRHAEQEESRMIKYMESYIIPMNKMEFDTLYVGKQVKSTTDTSWAVASTK
jgi:hypothetical protein